MRFLRTFALAALTALLSLALVDAVFDRTFPHFARLADNFSPQYLSRAIGDVDGSSVVYLGDSALWGYGLSSGEAAVTLLRKRGMPAENLSYEGGSPANTYAVLRLLLQAGVRPRAVVFNVNLKEFNEADSAYQKLYPGVERLAWPLLSTRQRALLVPTALPPTIDSTIDADLGSFWKLYGMRADVRYALFGDVDAAHALEAWIERRSGAAARAAAAHRPTPDRFEGTYDLSPIDASNVSMAFLRDTIALVRADHLKAFAILTPTNHTLLHEYIDVPEYRKNLATVRRALEAGGIGVIDYDRSFRAAEFIDNDHLTASGNERLARLLARDVRL
jgi:lysophospholipase L1-like esterase